MFVKYLQPKQSRENHVTKIFIGLMATFEVHTNWSAVPVCPWKTKSCNTTDGFYCIKFC